MRIIRGNLEAQRGLWGKIICHYREVETYAPQVPIDVAAGSSMNTKTYAVYLADAVSTGADPNHVATDDAMTVIFIRFAGSFEIPQENDNNCWKGRTVLLVLKNHCIAADWIIFVGTLGTIPKERQYVMLQH
jgi:hypothetical protein